MDIIDAIIKNNTTELSQLIAKGVDPNFTEDQDNITPLHYAAQRDCLEAAVLLIIAGAKINTPTIDGYLPLDIAKLHRSLKIVDLLSRACITPYDLIIEINNAGNMQAKNDYR